MFAGGALVQSGAFQKEVVHVLIFMSGKTYYKQNKTDSS